MLKKAIPVIINGLLGRMGKEIVRALNAEPGMYLYGGLESASHPMIGKDIAPLLGIEERKIILQSSIVSMSDCLGVIIDFSTPDSSIDLINSLKALDKSESIAMVIATTGFSAQQHSIIAEAAQKAPILLSPNMSLGMNLLYYLAGKCASTLSDEFDVEIVEMHHRFKKDAPGGSALALAQKIADARGYTLQESLVEGRRGVAHQGRSRKEIGIHAIRGGDCIGDHTVIFAGIGERIELRHNVSNRAVFAEGSIRAASWLFGKKPGLYSMQDVLNME